MEISTYSYACRTSHERRVLVNAVPVQNRNGCLDWAPSGVFQKMSVVTLIGLVAAFCTTLAYAPQALKTWRTRQTRDISLGMFALMVTGVALWLVYGVLIEDLPLILANFVTLSLAGTILVLKLRHG
jgi:MtN3 and saliva related transmembrane protein